MSKRIVFAVAALVIGLMPTLADAACFSEPEWRAAHVRILQTDLQVAALECANVQGHSYNDEYNTFIARFKDRLVANATALKAHFQRVFGGGAGRELDSFVTRLANDASERSMNDVSFCAHSAAFFQSALAITKEQFEQIAIDRVVDHSEIGQECPIAGPAKKTVTAAAK